jgi:uracil-DNA glycosylase
VSDAPERDLAPLLDYLRALGWEDLYVPAREGRSEAAAAVRSAGLRAAREAARPGAGAARTGSPSTPPGANPAGGPRPLPRTQDVEAEAGHGKTLQPPLPEVVIALFTEGLPDAAAERAAALSRVATAAMACQRCGLAAGRRTVVFGTGDPNADLMFVGEGPGAEEDRQGLPFVGPAGQLLTRIIQAIGLGREQVYIANVVKCRPPGNRDPRPDEVAACRGFLEAQIRLVRPRVLVALGRVAAQTLLGADLPVARMRGHWHELLGVPLRVTYHPAAVLRDAGLKRPTWDDMQVVRDRLAAGQ